MPTENDAIIKVRNMVAQYGEDVILNRISFDVKRGERFVILGGSGCGKSTLLRHLVGLNLPAAGAVGAFAAEIRVGHGDVRLAEVD